MVRLRSPATSSSTTISASQRSPSSAPAPQARSPKTSQTPPSRRARFGPSRPDVTCNGTSWPPQSATSGCDDRLATETIACTPSMMGRRVGVSPSGVEYCLIGRITVDDLAILTGHDAALVDAFGMAHELALCGVDQEDTIESSNILDIARYDSVEEIPTDFLPGARFHSFPSDLEITAY